jgi:hypothetical protein
MLHAAMSPTPSSIADLSAEQIAGALFTPAQPGLDAARTVVAGLESADDAWSALGERGLVPEAWRASPPPRLFVSVLDDNLRIGTTGSDALPLLAVPPTVAACVTVAASVEGIVRAEETLRALRPALTPWNILDLEPRPPEPPVWDLLSTQGVVPATTGHSLHAGVAGRFAREAVEVAKIRDLAATSQAIADRNAAVCEAAQERTRIRFQRWSLVTLSAYWTLAVQHDLVVPSRLRGSESGHGNAPRAVRGKRFRDLADPFPLLWSIFLAGFAVESKGPSLELQALRVRL